MGRAAFFPRLALQSMVKNRRFTLPYLLSLMGAAAAFYVTVALSNAEALPDRTRYEYLSAFMVIGTFVIALFAAIFLPYIGGFLMKQRRRELGLYSILGLGKNHIARLLALETLYAALVGVAGGVLVGSALKALITWALCALTGLPSYFGVSLSWPAAFATAALFGAILFLNLLRNLWQVYRQSPVELMRETSAGEREPKSRRLLALLGVLALGGGYGIAVTARSATQALALYFVAVFLVVIGTYALFAAVSIVVLKALRRNKRFYYRTGPFIGVSGMLYRMGRNAVGLANICILSTMVLVMVSGTLSLYLGSEQTLRSQFPGNLCLEVRYDPLGENPGFDAAALGKTVMEALADYPAAPVYGCRSLQFYAVREGSHYTWQRGTRGEPEDLTLLAAEDCRALPGIKWGEPSNLRFSFPSEEGVLEVEAEAYPVLSGAPAQGGMVVSLLQERTLALENEALDKIFSAYHRAQPEDRKVYQVYRGFWQVEGSEESLAALPRTLEDRLSAGPAGSWHYLRVNTLEETAPDFYAMNGGFFFLGLFLGVLFILAAALILYYKQVSEGYEDRGRYQIMQKVGLEPKMVRQSINGQVLAVFFLPLLVAGVHTAFDYGLVVRLLTLFGLRTAFTTLLCTVGTFLAFAAVYYLVFRLTARAYRHIVEA